MRRALAISVGIYLAAFAYLWLRWDAIPDPVPIHIGPGGEVDRWVVKSWFSVSATLWIGLVVTAMLALCSLPERLTTARREITGTAPGTATEALPYSDTAAQRAAALLDKTNTFLGQFAVATAVLLSLVQLMMCFPHLVPMWLSAAAIAAYCAFAVVEAIRITRRAKTTWEVLPPDAEEQRRIQRLKLKASMGFYNEPLDPMAVAVLPAEPGKVQLNTAHPDGKRQLQRIVWSIVGATFAIIALVVLL